MVAVDLHSTRTAHSRKCRIERQCIQLSHCHLDIDNVLRRESCHRRRADVVDTQRQIAKRATKAGRDPRELLWPLRAVVHDDDLAVLPGVQLPAPALAVFYVALPRRRLSHAWI